MNQGRNESFRNKQKLLPRDISESLGKLPPQALDLEEAVLGAIMLEKDAVTSVIDMLRPEDFYVEAHKVIYEAITNLYRDREPVDMRTVVNRLRKEGKLELVEGAYKIAELTAKVSSAANVEYHARIVAEMSMKRKLIEAASVIHHDCYEDTSDVFEILDDVQAKMDQISGKYIRSMAKSSNVLYNESIRLHMEARQTKGLIGVPSGYTTLDRLIGGWCAPDLVIIAARPSMGKSAFVGNVCRNAAIDFKVPVALFSLEMASKQVMDRLISAEAEIELDKVIKGKTEDHELTVLGHKSQRLSSAPIFIDDTPALSILELRAKCRRLKAEHGVQLIVIDYLQLMRGEQGGNREQEIASISRALKGIAKELNVPVLALSQLSRGVESRGGDKKPQLSDLRESGSIEQDADVVMFLYRAEYYKITVYEDGMPTQGVMECIIAKNRNGACDSVRLKFIGKYCKVTDFNDEYQPTPLQPVKSYKDFQVSRQEHLGGDDETPF